MRLLERLRGHVTDAVLVLLAVVLSVVVIVDRGRIGTREADDCKYQLLDAWRAGDVTRVHVRHGGGEIELTRTSRSDGWRLVADGREVQADEQAVGQYLVSLEFASFERTIDDLPDAEMGLDPPFLALELEMGDLEYRLRLGKEAPTPAGARYAEIDGGARGRRRYVVGRELVESLTIDPGELRAKNLVPYFASQLASLALDGPEHRWKLERGGWGGRTAGAFLLERAGVSKVRASRRQLEALLVALGRLEVERFVELPEKPAAGAHTLVLTPLDGAAERGGSSFGGACEGGALVVRRAPLPAAGCAPADAVNALLMDAERLVDQHVLGAAEGDVMELALRGDSEVEVARREHGWHMRKPADGDVEEPAMRALLDGLVAAEGTLVEDPGDLAELGLSPPRARIRVVALPERGGDIGSKDRIEEIEVGTPQDGWVHVRRHDDGAVLRLSEDAAAALVPRPALLRSTSVYDVPLERFATLSLDCAGKKQRMSREETGSWSLERPETKGLGADMTLANQLAGLLGKLAAVRWVAEEPTERFSLDEPWCTIEAEVRVPDGEEEEPRTLSLRLGGETQGGYFALAGTGRAVLVAPRNIGEQASRWLLDRGALILDPASITRVTLEVTARPSLVLLRQSGRWIVERDPTSRAGTAAGNALRELMAEEVVSLGAPREEQGFSAPQLIARIELESGKRLELKVGAGDALGGTSVYYLRRSDIDATFAVPRSRVEPLLAAP